MLGTRRCNLAVMIMTDFLLWLMSNGSDVVKGVKEVGIFTKDLTFVLKILFLWSYIDVRLNNRLFRISMNCSYIWGLCNIFNCKIWFLLVFVYVSRHLFCPERLQNIKYLVRYWSEKEKYDNFFYFSSLG